MRRHRARQSLDDGSTSNATLPEMSSSTSTHTGGPRGADGRALDRIIATDSAAVWELTAQPLAVLVGELPTLPARARPTETQHGTAKAVEMATRPEQTRRKQKIFLTKVNLNPDLVEAMGSGDHVT